MSLRFLCRDGRDTNHLHIPTLSWFEAHQLQNFFQNLSLVKHPDIHSVDLSNAGLRLTGSADRRTAGRSIRIEPLGAPVRSFSPFTVHVSYHDMKAYTGKLYNRLWEFFTKS